MTDEIRAATEADIPALAAVIRAAFEEYRGRLDPPSSAHAKTAEIARAELRGGGAFVALADQAVAGCVFWHPRPGHLYLDRLAVLPAARGRGLARLLIGAVEAQAALLGLPAVRLAVRQALPAQRAYYERLGYAFLAAGTHAGYPAPTFATLEKPVAAPAPDRRVS